MLAPILAVEALLLGEGAAPVNLKFCFEGQEEIGSPQIPAFMPPHKERFACDLAVSADGGQYSETEPILLMSLRGISGMQIDVRGASTDLHSGLHGGRVQNPIHALTQILSSLRRADGSVAVEGFYGDVVEHTAEERAAIAQVPFEPDEYLRQLGLDEEFGEPGYTNRERGWIRPNAGDERHLGWISGRGDQDGPAQRGARKDHLPPGSRPGPGAHFRSAARAYRAAYACRRDR